MELAVGKLRSLVDDDAVGTAARQRTELRLAAVVYVAAHLCTHRLGRVGEVGCSCLAQCGEVGGEGVVGSVAGPCAVCLHHIAGSIRAGADAGRGCALVVDDGDVVERERVVGALHGDDRLCARCGGETVGDYIGIAAGVVVYHAVLHPQRHVHGIGQGGYGGTREGGVVLEDAVLQGYLGRRGGLVHTAYQHTAAVGLVGGAGSVGVGEGVAVDGDVGTRLDAQQVVESRTQVLAVDVAVQFGAVGHGVALVIRWVGILGVGGETAQYGEGQYGGLYAETLRQRVVLLEGVGGGRGKGAGTGAYLEVVAAGLVYRVGGGCAVARDDVHHVAVVDGGEVVVDLVYRRTAVCLCPRRAVAVDNLCGAVEVEAQTVFGVVVGKHHVVVVGHVGTGGRGGLEGLAVEVLLWLVDVGGGQERITRSSVAEDGALLALPEVVDIGERTDDTPLVVEVVCRVEGCVRAAQDKALALVIGGERGGSALVDVAPRGSVHVADGVAVEAHCLTGGVEGENLCQ